MTTFVPYARAHPRRKGDPTGALSIARPVCQHSAHQELGSKDGFAIVLCPNCLLRHVHPMPTGDVISAYDDSYRVNEKNTRNSKREMRKLRRIVRPLVKIAPGPRFLDLGCNTGFGAEAAREL